MDNKSPHFHREDAGFVFFRKGGNGVHDTGAGPESGRQLHKRRQGVWKDEF